MTPKGIAALVALIAIVIAGVAYIFVTRQTETVPEQETSTPIIQQPVPSEALRAPTPSGNQIAGWKTYRSDTHGLMFQYPPNFSSPQEHQEVPGQYAITIGPLGMQYFTPERNRVAGFTLDQFTHMPWLHKADDPYTEITVGGMRAALYDLVLPSYPRGEEEPIRGYARTLQVGLETPGGGFLELSADSALFPDAASARTADLSWFPALLSTVVFDK